jgi:hypothetical protein
MADRTRTSVVFDESGVAGHLLGEFSWGGVLSGELLDFEALTLAPGGRYVARVVATLVNPGVRSFGATPCMLPEEGEWNVYFVSGTCRIRVRPTTGPARVYSLALVGGNLEIGRRGRRTLLLRDSETQPRAGDVWDAPPVSGERPLGAGALEQGSALRSA